jgi:hypothetical protein
MFLYMTHWFFPICCVGFFPFSCVRFSIYTRTHISLLCSSYSFVLRSSYSSVLCSSYPFVLRSFSVSLVFFSSTSLVSLNKTEPKFTYKTYKEEKRKRLFSYFSHVVDSKYAYFCRLSFLCFISQLLPVFRLIKMFRSKETVGCFEPLEKRTIRKNSYVVRTVTNRTKCCHAFWLIFCVK